MKYYSWEGIYHYIGREYFWQYDRYGYKRLFHKDVSKEKHQKGEDWAYSEEDLKKKLKGRYIELKWCGEIEPPKPLEPWIIYSLIILLLTIFIVFGFILI